MKAVESRDTLPGDRPLRDSRSSMKYLSVCSGIEAATVAWHGLGWQPVAFSEIEKFPSAVLAHHYPSVPNWGDMTKFQEWPDAAVDVLVGGTPCQSFSVAGLRKGLEDPRGNLMLTYLAIARRYRPRWVVWENVPGVLSSNRGRDFGTFLGALGELGYGWAYRVLDAQWFGVAQRRRRVFVVGCLGDWERAAAVLFERESVRRDSPPSREARQGAARGAAGGVGGGGWPHDIAGTIDAHYDDKMGLENQHIFNQKASRFVPAPVAFHNRQDPDISGGITHPLGAKDNGLGVLAFKIRGGVEREDGSRGSTNIGKQAGKGYLGSEDRAFTVGASQDQHIAVPVHFRKSRRAQSVDDHETWVEDGVSNTLNTFDVGDVRATDVVAQPVAFVDVGATLKGGSGARGYPDPSDGNGHNIVAQSVATGSHWDHPSNPHPTLNQSFNTGAIGYGNQELFSQRGGGLVPVAFQQNTRDEVRLMGGDGQIAGALMAEPGMKQQNYIAQPATVYERHDQDARVKEVSVAPTLHSKSDNTCDLPMVQTAMQVRRLTPVECERLQGFPDGYTNIPWRGKLESPDGPRYKALGNSMAVPCMKWIGERIAEVDDDR